MARSATDGDAVHRRGGATPSTGHPRSPEGSLFAPHPGRRRTCSMHHIALRVPDLGGAVERLREFAVFKATGASNRSLLAGLSVAAGAIHLVMVGSHAEASNSADTPHAAIVVPCFG